MALPNSLHAQEDLAEKGLQYIQSIEAAFRRAIERARPSVVSIFVVTSEQIRDKQSEHFLFAPISVGSGVIVGEKGLVLTCFHVVRGIMDEPSHRLLVRLHDGKEYRAQLYAGDPRSDLAVIQLLSDEPLQLQTITIGDGSKLFRGQFVLALGNPYGVAAPDGNISASWGIVSNIRRRALPVLPLDTEQSLLIHGTLVQTDARLNMGISGGALIDTKGELVGVTMALAAAIGFETPGGFAVPTDLLTRRIIETLRQGREVEYGFIGINVETVRKDDIDIPGMEGGTQVKFISSFVPAFRAGLQMGDIIIRIDGKPIKNSNDLILAVGSRLVGTGLDAEIIREGDRILLKIPLAKYPVKGRMFVTNKRPSRYGIRVDHLSILAGQATGFGFGRFLNAPDYTPASGVGVVIRELESGSAASDEDLRENQIITHVNGKPIFTPDQFEQEVARAEPPVHLTVFQRRDEVIFESPPIEISPNQE